jgi:hypothetical protein
MNKRVLIAAVMLSFWLFPTFADTPYRTVQDLYQMCKDSEKDFICIGYISGVGDLMQAIGVEHPDLQAFAMYGKPSYGAMEQAFKNWAEKTPDCGMRINYSA